MGIFLRQLKSFVIFIYLIDRNCIQQKTLFYRFLKFSKKTYILKYLKTLINRFKLVQYDFVWKRSYFQYVKQIF